MKKISLLFLSFMIMGVSILSAQQTITLLFTGAKTDNSYQQFDSVVITNITRSWSETIYYPDTIFIIPVGEVEIKEMNNAVSEVKALPNPFNGQTEVSISLTQEDNVTMQIFDINGKQFAEYSNNLQQGTHFFQINLTTPQTYFLTIRTSEGLQTLKMVNTGNGGQNDIFSRGMTPQLMKVRLKSTTTHPFQLGDIMQYVGYATINGQVYESQGITQVQNVSEVFVLRFDIAIPTVTTDMVSNISATTATCGGNVTDDGGAPVTARGVCWSTSPNPTISNSYTINGSGTGTFTSQMTGLIFNTTYYVRAYASNNAGTAYGQERSFTTPNCPLTMTDVDGNSYPTVPLGTQCWMAMNLRTTKYADGTAIALGSSTSTTVAYRYYPDNNSANVSTYGYLYNWKAVMGNSSSSTSNPSGVQGICPTGWHVPSTTEFDQMQTWVGSQSQYQCSGNSTDIAKALATTTGWTTSTNSCAVGNGQTSNNATGFSAPPAGYYGGSYNGFGNFANFWSATENNSTCAYYRYLYYNVSYVGSSYDDKYYGFSVRCVRD